MDEWTNTEPPYVHDPSSFNLAVVETREIGGLVSGLANNVWFCHRRWHNVNVARISHYSFICFSATPDVQPYYKFSNSNDRVRFFSNLRGGVLCFRTRFACVLFSHLHPSLRLLSAGQLSYSQLGTLGHGRTDMDRDRHGHPVKLDSCVRLGPWNRRNYPDLVGYFILTEEADIHALQVGCNNQRRDWGLRQERTNIHDPCNKSIFYIS
jgi:hypothetical protein